MEVLQGIETIRHTVSVGSFRHELHQACRTLFRNRPGVVGRFDGDYSVDQRALKRVDAGDFLDYMVILGFERLSRTSCRCPRLPYTRAASCKRNITLVRRDVAEMHHSIFIRK